MRNSSLEKWCSLVLVVCVLSGCQTIGSAEKGKKFTFHESPSRAIAYSPDGRFLVVLRGLTLNDAVVLDPVTLSVRHVIEGYTQKGPRKSHIPGSVVFSPDGRWLAIVGIDDRLSLWNTRSWAESKFFHDTIGVKGVTFLEGGQLLATIGPGNHVRIWNVDSGLQTGSLNTHSSDVLSVASISAGDWIAVGGLDGTVQIWDVKYHVRRTRLDQERPVLSLAFSPDGTDLATSVEGLEAKLWHIQTNHTRNNRESLKTRPWMTTATQVTKWTVIVTLEVTLFTTILALGILGGHGGGGGGGFPVGLLSQSAATLNLEYNCPVAFSPDGRYVGMVQYTQNIRGNYHVEVYDAKTFKHLSGYMGGVSALAFSRDGKVLAIGGRHEAVILIDPVTGKTLGMAKLRHPDPRH